MNQNIAYFLWIFCGFLILATLYLIIKSVVQKLGDFTASDKNVEDIDDIKKSLKSIEERLENK